MNRLIATVAALGIVTLATPARAQSPFEAGAEEQPAASAPPPSTKVLAAETGMPAPNEPRDIDRPPPKPPSPLVGMRVDGGYAQRRLVSLPLTGADMGLAFGAQPSRQSAIWGSSRLFLGSTENGLDVFSFRLGADVEGVLFDRLRLGGGLHMFVVGIGRAARDQTILSWGPAGSLTARLDLIQSDGFAIFARGAVEGGYEIYNGTIFWGPTLGGGVDFDLAGQRASLK